MLPTLALLQILKVCCEPSLRSPRPILQIFVVYSWYPSEPRNTKPPSTILRGTSFQLPKCHSFPIRTAGLWDDKTLKRMTAAREKGSSQNLDQHQFPIKVQSSSHQFTSVYNHISHSTLVHPNHIKTSSKHHQTYLKILKSSKLKPLKPQVHRLQG